MGAAGHRSIWSLGYGGGRQSETENENIERHEIPATNLIEESKGLPWKSPDDLAVLILCNRSEQLS